MKLGISLYPEKESLEEIANYIKLSSKYGFTQIFTSMFSVKGDNDEIINYFTRLCDIAHQNKMEVCADVNAQMFKRFGASESNLKVFKDIGFDELRMDFNFGDERDITLINNPENIKIQFNASFKEMIDKILSKDSNAKFSLCHNFYPERYTGTSRAKYKFINDTWKNYENIEVAAFMTSNVPNAHGPWPVFDGYPTIEDHRGASISDQIRDLVAMNTDIIYFGNAFASESELHEAQEAIGNLEDYQENDFEKIVKNFLPSIGKKRFILSIYEANGLNETEKAILYNYKKHCDLGDSSEYMLRSRITRTIYGKESIPQRRAEMPYFKKGDILIVNDNLKYYCGELQICLKDMANDGQRNYVGSLPANEIQFVDLIEAGDYFSFEKK